MKRHATALLLTVLCLTLFPVAASHAQGGESAPALSPKGIYYDVDRYQRTGIKFYITMDEKGKDRRVPVTYPFHSGDRFTFNFEINRGTHIYVFNRTEMREISAVSSGYHPKRISRTRPVSGVVPATERLGKPRLLFPTLDAGSNNRLSADVSREVPHRGYFAMDEECGTEKLYVVISDRRLDFSDDFDARTGKIRYRSGSPDPQAVARLETRFAEWKRNADVELVPKGIVHEVESYGVSIDPSTPALVEIDLKHYR